MRQVGHSAPSNEGINIPDPRIQRSFCCAFNWVGLIILTKPFKGVFLRLQLGASLFLSNPFKGFVLRLQLVWPKLLVPLLLGAPEGLPKVDFRVCESGKLSAILNFGCAKVLNYQRFSKKTIVWLEF